MIVSQKMEYFSNFSIKRARHLLNLIKASRQVFAFKVQLGWIHNTRKQAIARSVITWPESTRVLWNYHCTHD